MSVAPRLPARLRSRLAGFLALLLCLAPLAAFAVSNPADMLPDPALEARARALGQDVRCMVCQNQSIEDSEAGLARDLRLVVRERITAGDSDAQVMSFLHERYGDFVLLRPPFAWNTAILWATPVLAILFGFGLILMSRRTTARTPPPAPLDAAERQRLAAIEASLENRDGTKA